MNKTVLLFSILIILIIGCKKEISNGKNSLTTLLPESAGVNCPSGGFKISTGIDFNENGILDPEEIDAEEYVCNGNNGENGLNSLIKVITEPSSEYCGFGGLKIESGQDINNNNVLEENEIQAINYVCNGENGQSTGEITAIRIPFNLAYKWRYAENNWTSEFQDGLLSGFDKGDYSGFDSIIFVSWFRRGGESTDPLWLRLYDYTDDSGISNSELISVIPDSMLIDPESRVFKSENFFNSILSGPRTIGIQYKKASTEIRAISIHYAELILFKRD